MDSGVDSHNSGRPRKTAIREASRSAARHDQYARDIEAIRNADATKSILTATTSTAGIMCRDDGDSSLSTLIPQLIADLWEAGRQPT